MGFLWALLILLVALLVYTVVSTVIKIALLLTTKYRYENNRIFIPTILTLAIWTADFYFCFYTLGKLFDKPILEVALNVLIKTNDLSDKLVPIFGTIIVFFVIGILLQAIAYFAVNINVNAIFNHLRYQCKKIFHFEKKQDESNITPEEKEQPTPEAPIPEEAQIASADSIQETSDITVSEVNTALNNTEVNETTKEITVDEDIASPSEEKDSGIMLHHPLEKLDFLSATISSVFSFCTILFITLVLFAIGDILSNYII